MGRHHSTTTVAILTHINAAGSANYLEVERAINLGGHGMHRIGKLREEGYIEPLPKQRGQLKRYRVTGKGRQVIDSCEKQTERVVAFRMPVWTPEKWMPARAGAMAAFSIPSRGF